jgi:hypothetical protein
VRRQVQVLLGVLGVVLVACSGLVWWSAEQALGPAPEIRSSTRGGMSSCGYRPGLTSCDPPVLSEATIWVVVVLAVAGAGLLVVALMSTLRRRV